MGNPGHAHGIAAGAGRAGYGEVVKLSDMPMTMGFRCAKDSNSFLRGIAGTAAVGHDDGGTAIDAEADIMAMKRGADHWGREHVGDTQRLARPGLWI